jgi:hypothetical protein
MHFPIGAIFSEEIKRQRRPIRQYARRTGKVPPFSREMTPGRAFLSTENSFQLREIYFTFGNHGFLM